MSTHTSPMLGVECRACGEFIFSIGRHDYTTCDCGKPSVDGGQSASGGQRVLWRDGITDPPEFERRTVSAKPRPEPVDVRSLPQYSVVTFATASGARLWAMRESADPAAPWLLSTGSCHLPEWLAGEKDLRVGARP